METKKYKPRMIDNAMEKYLQTFGAVCVEGPKWCGKTWTSEHHSKSQIYIGDPEGNFQNRKLAVTDPSFILEGDKPRLVDEWQEVPELWDAVRFVVDKSSKKGQFILTGSATPNHKGVMHSGTGRIARLRMYPMSLYESGESSGDVSLQNICKGKFKSVMTGEVSLLHLTELIVRGGWPANLGLPLKNAALLPQEYLKAVLDDDVHRIDGVKRDSKKMGLLMRSLARNESTTATNKTLKKDIAEIDNNDIDDDTVSSYLDIFKRLFITDNIPPYSAKIRSSVRVKQAEKRHLCDPSLACALLKVTPKMLIGDLQTLGFLFESLVERDLKIYAESFGAKVFHYQDYNDKEIDSVIELADGSWIGIEIKLGANEIDSGAENLLAIKKAIKNDAKGGKLPKALIVICGMSNAAYKRTDGVYVVPITALRE